MPTPTNNTATTALFSSAYLGNVRYYAAMLAAGGKIAVDANEKIGRHSWMHNHCRIVGANGVQTLTIPVEHIDIDTGNILMRDLPIAEHGNWRRIHWGALFSAYGKTPFFEYFQDDLHTIYQRPYKWLIDFNMAMHEAVVEFLDLPITTVKHTEPITDWRGKVGGKNHDAITSIADKPYYNIWSERHGHIPALSIIDLLSNCGRESIFTLLEMLNSSLI